MALENSGLPELKSRWKHRNNGQTYRVLMLTNVNATRRDYPLTVVYETCSLGEVWSRPFERWHESMKEIKENK